MVLQNYQKKIRLFCLLIWSRSTPASILKPGKTPYFVCKIFKNISPDLVWSCRTCLANLGVRSCSVRKLICPVRLSPIGGHCACFVVGQTLPNSRSFLLVVLIHQGSTASWMDLNKRSLRRPCFNLFVCAVLGPKTTPVWRATILHRSKNN